MTPYKLPVQRHRRRPSRKTQSENPIASVDGPYYDIREIRTCNILIFKYMSRYPLIAVKDTFRQSGLYQAPILRQGELFHRF